MDTKSADHGIADYESEAVINPFDAEYHRLLRHILEKGVKKTDRTGTGTISVFGYQMRFDLPQGFPLLTTKKIHLRSIIHELLWFLKGDTNTKYLKDNGITIWDEWADENGDLGPIYGYQWRSWPTADGRHIDQIAEVIETLKRNPDSRRIIVSAWNVGEIPNMKLPPCHAFFQFYAAPLPLEERLDFLARNNPELHARFMSENDGEAGEVLHEWLTKNGVPSQKLSCQLYQRSADVFLGVPFNIASYALLTMMMAQVCNMVVGDFVHTLGDAHIYLNHLDQVNLQLSREPRKPPTMHLNPEVTDHFAFKYEDFALEGYDPHPGIKAKVAV